MTELQATHLKKGVGTLMKNFQPYIQRTVKGVHSNCPLKFTIPMVSENNFTDLRNTYLYLQFRLQKNIGDVNAMDKVIPVNQIFHYHYG